MTAHYDLTGGSDAAYASLPGAADMDFAPQNMTPLKSNLTSGQEVAGSLQLSNGERGADESHFLGCHPSRWVYELLNNDFTVCDLFERARQLIPTESRAWEHKHKLVMNGNQSFAVGATRVISSVCLDCHFHFVFKMKWEEDHAQSLCDASSACWPLRDNVFPWHHLVWVGSDSDTNITRDHSKYYPLLARESFVCSAPPCTFQVVLEVSQPRMPQWWIELLLDQDTIRQQIEFAKAEDPIKYEAATQEWTRQAPVNLNTYLKNQLESTPETTRSISKRNKRFAVVFGPRCYPLFRQLGFDEKIDEQDGVDEGSFTPSPPAPPGGPMGATELGTYRSFVEDVRAEVQNLIHRGNLGAEPPSFITEALHTDLGCQEIPSAALSGYAKTERYKLLGVLPAQSREIIVNAYKRQWELMPGRRKELVEALMSVAHDSQDDLLSDYAVTQSSLFDSQAIGPQLDEDGSILQSLAYLGLSPPNRYSADQVIEAFRKKMTESPQEASTARNVLMAMAQGSTDDLYQAKLLMETDAKMSLETARAVLELSPGPDDAEAAVVAAREKIASAMTAGHKEILLDALDSIAEHTASAVIKQNVMELRHMHATYGTSAYNGTKPGASVDLNLPVGLDNIGNTCYLNSLLQYLFTVEPVREVVLGYESFALGLEDSSIEERRIGGNKMQMDRGEAVVARAFAQELASLFQTLQSSDKAATRPSQRLANAVLLSTHTLLTSGRTPGKTPTESQTAPMVSVDGSSWNLVTDNAKDVEMSNPFADTVEAGSVSSTQTLIDIDGPEELDDKEHLVQSTFTDDILEQKVLVSDVKLADGQLKPADIDMAEPESLDVDRKVLNALEHQKRSSGTDQQDVEEVMGSIINRLQAAIRPSAVDAETGIQLEKIMETFFVTTINYTKKFVDKKYQEEISFDRSITAFPAESGSCSLYDALGRNFDQQILDESKLSRYTAIKTLPPILHILIQRTQSNGSKNGNAVIIPETLYLDRYMDTAHDSPAFQRRVQDWVISDRINDLRAQLARVDTNPSYMNLLESRGYQDLSDQPVRDVGSGDSPVEIEHIEESWDFDGPMEDDFVVISGKSETECEPTPPAPPALEGVKEMHEAIKTMMEEELDEHETNLAAHLEGEKEIAYRLHAVICHRGHLTSGHYWVWIHDFEEGVWRWYNDADVKENKDTQEVLKTLSSGGEPYFLCYVRDGDKDDYVNVPKRHVPSPDVVSSPPGLIADTAPVSSDNVMELETETGPSKAAETAHTEPGQITEPSLLD